MPDNTNHTSAEFHNARARTENVVLRENINMGVASLMAFTLSAPLTNDDFGIAGILSMACMMLGVAVGYTRLCWDSDQHIQKQYSGLYETLTTEEQVYQRIMPKALVISTVSQLTAVGGAMIMRAFS